MLKRILCMLICVMLFLGAFSGCKKEEVNFVYDPTDLGTNAANVLMGGGLFAYDDGFIYFYGGDGIIEYNMETGKTVCLEGIGDVKCEFYLSEDFVYVLRYNFLINQDEVGRSLTAITKDGKASERLFNLELQSIYQPYFEGMELYYYWEDSLYRRNLETGEEECLISSVRSYYLDDKYIYVLGDDENEGILFRSPRDQIEFEKVQLSFAPWSIYVCDEKIFLRGSTVVLYENGVETSLPIKSFSYQMLDNYLIYKDEADKDPWLSLKAYNLETGEIKLLSKNVSTVQHFCIFEQRYICFVTVDEIGYGQYMLYDWQTGEMTQMYPKPNT